MLQKFGRLVVGEIYVLYMEFSLRKIHWSIECYFRLLTSFIHTSQSGAQIQHAVRTTLEDHWSSKIACAAGEKSVGIR